MERLWEASDWPDLQKSAGYYSLVTQGAWSSSAHPERTHSVINPAPKQEVFLYGQIVGEAEVLHAR